MQPDDHDGHELIHLGGETAVVVPLEEYRMLRALREAAEAEIDDVIAEHEAWKQARRPGGTIPHDSVAAELLGNSR